MTDREKKYHYVLKRKKRRLAIYYKIKVSSILSLVTI